MMQTGVQIIEKRAGQSCPTPWSGLSQKVEICRCFVFVPGQSCPNAGTTLTKHWDSFDQKSPNQLKTNRFWNLPQRKGPPKAYFPSRNMTLEVFCRGLRQVCGKLGAISPRPGRSAGTPCRETRQRTAGNLGTSAALFALILALPVAPLASEWRSVNSQTGFQPSALIARQTARVTPNAESGFVIRPFTRASVSSLAGLRDLIAKAEVREGYDSVQLGARIKPAKAPTKMRMDEVLAWIKATPGQPHAIGRYQFIPATFRRLKRDLSISGGALFNAAIQDQMADALIMEAGYRDFMSGRLSADRFMDRLAKVWAGLPLTSGKSAYHGYAGNRATLSRATYERQFNALFPWAKR